MRKMKIKKNNKIGLKLKDNKKDIKLQQPQGNFIFNSFINNTLLNNGTSKININNNSSQLSDVNHFAKIGKEKAFSFFKIEKIGSDNFKVNAFENSKNPINDCIQKLKNYKKDLKYLDDMIEERQEDLDSFNCIFQELLKNQSDINQLYNEFEVGIKNTKNIVQLEKNNLPQNFNLENFIKKLTIKFV